MAHVRIFVRVVVEDNKLVERAQASDRPWMRTELLSVSPVPRAAEMISVASISPTMISAGLGLAAWNVAHRRS